MTLDAWLSLELDRERAAGRARQLSVVPEGVVSFASNDYLGLSSHPQLKEAAERSLASGTLGAGASRLIAGHTRAHQELEDALADWKHTARALTFPSGYAAACGTIPALVGPGDTVILDKLAHACLIDGAKLSGATLRVFEHNQPDALEDILRWTREHHPECRILVVTESVFSMDGDTAPLAALCALKERYGAWLMVDEAHATGVFGPDGRGLCGTPEVAGRVEVQMGTLGKALGTAGGFIAGSDALIQLLIHRARTFLFTTASPPILAAATLAAVRLARGREGHERRLRLARLLEHFRHSAPELPVHSPIIPVVVGDEVAASARAAALLAQGFHVPAIRYPTVARGAARLRISLTADHREEDITALLQALQTAGKS
jgi:8-amino-7-oxononanoate synthase